MQVVSADYNRKIQVFDYIANKVVAQAEGGYTFSFSNNGKRIVSINDQLINVFETKGLTLLQSIQN